MNKNSLIGTLLISVLIMYYVGNSAKTARLKAEEEAFIEQQEKEKVETTIKEEIAKEELNINNSPEIKNDSAKLSEIELKSKDKYGAFYQSISGVEETIILENDLVQIDISNKGAQLKKVALKNYTTWDKKPLFLINNTSELNFSFKTNNNRIIETSDLYYDVTKINDNKVSLKLKISEDQYVEQLYTLEDGSYFLDFKYNFHNVSQHLNSSDKEFKSNWNYTVIKQEKEIKLEKQKSTIYWKVKGEDVESLTAGGVKDEEIPSSDWIAFKDQFFNSTFFTEGLIKKGIVQTNIDLNDTSNIGEFNYQIVFDETNSNQYDFQYYFGPNDYKLLKSFENDQEEVVELSANFFLFRWVKHITKWVILPIFHTLEKLNLKYGLIIILMTLIIKMGLMPLTFKSYVSTAKTKLLKPQIDKLKEKYKDDQQTFASEQMKLYQTTGVSMFGGCLPMMLQMPFLLAMFYFFPSSIELRQESFLWATDLSTYDTIMNLPFHIPIYGSHVSGFTLLMTLSSLAMAKFNPQMQNNNVQPGMEMMKYMPYIFPVFLMLMFNSWSSALTFYYFLSNIITLIQQIFINKFMIDEDKLLQQIEDNKKKPKKQGGFREKLAESYKQQQLKAQQNAKK